MEQCSFSPELDTSRAIKYVNECISYDNSVPEFFTAVTNSDQINYFRTKYTENMLTVSSNAPFPPIIGSHYMTANEYGSCGILPKIQRYYYILDNKLFLWHTNTAAYDSRVVEQITEEEKLITAVATIDPNAFFTKSTRGLLAVATPTYIKVYPISDDKIDTECFYTTNKKIDFTPVSLCSGDPGQLFIGAADGHLYSIHVDVDQESTATLPDNQGPFIVQNLTFTFIISSIANFFSASKTPIWKIVYEPSTRCLASIDSNHCINFYHYSESRSLKHNNAFTPPKGIEFVTIVPVDKCDSLNIRFIAVTKKGERYYFGTLNLSKIALRGQRKGPAEVGTQEVVDVFYSCGYTALLCKNSIIDIQSTNIDSDNCCEFVAVTAINGSGICITGTTFGLCGSDNRLYHEPILSQHLNYIPDLYILTSAGGCIMKFQPPCAFIHQFFHENHFTYNKEVFELMQRFSINDECCAICLLLTYLHPDRSSEYLYIASEFSRLFSFSCHIEGEEDMTTETENKRILGPDHLTPITHAFFICASRLLSLIWTSPVFQTNFSKEGFWKISLQFRTLSPDFVKRLNQLVNLSNRYLKNAEKKTTHENERDQLLFEIESNQLRVLQSFLGEMIEILNLIIILSKQKSEFLTLPFKNLKADVITRLTESPFAPTTETHEYLVTALREYVFTLFRDFKDMIRKEKESTMDRPISSKDNVPFGYNPLSAIGPITKRHPYQVEATLDLLATEINEECPKITKSSEYQIMQAQYQLEEASFVQSKEEKKRLVHNATNIFLSNCTEKLQLDAINKACSSLIGLGFDSNAVEIVEACVRHIDEDERAYYWYINGCNKKELNSIKIFDQIKAVYNCALNAAFSDEGMKSILATEDQLFILLAFQHLLHRNETDRLLKIEHPLVLEFLTENAPKLVAQYYITHERFEEAVNYLINYASNISAPDDHPESEISFDHRIELLQTAMNYARKERLINLIDECKIRIECAKLQKQITTKRGEPLKPLNELFEFAEEHYLWSYLLKIISLMPTDDIVQREMDIKTVWLNFLLNGDGCQKATQQQTNSIREADINLKLKSLFNEINPQSDVLDTNYIVPAFEDFRNYMRERETNEVGEFRSQWVVDTLLKLNVDGSKLYTAYASLINCDYLPDERYNQLIYVALLILSRGYIGDLSLIEDKVKKLLEDPQKSYYQQIKKLMDILQ